MPGNVRYLDPAVRWKHRFPGMAEREPSSADVVAEILDTRFAGADSAAPPRLGDAPPEAPRACLDSVLDEVARLLAVGIVHGDLSAFNILLHDGNPWLIDFSYSTAYRRPKERP